MSKIDLYYSRDQHNKKILIDSNNDYQVMMEWEKDYMEALVKELNPIGDVLEIGFGMGYSATAIQSYNIKSHTIIEDDQEVLKEAYKWAVKQPHKVDIVEGTWQTKLKDQGKFDSIFFDDAPNIKHKENIETRVFDFFYDILESHVNKNARFVFYLDNEFVYWPSPTCVNWSCKSMNISIPENVKYVPNNNKEKMFIPLITFTEGTKKIPRVIIDKFI